MNRWALVLTALSLCTFAIAKDVVLLSGFDPFGKLSVNNSWVIAQQVRTQLMASRSDVEVVTCLLPTSYNRAIPALEKCLNELPEKPTLVISLGAGPCNVKWETRAHNLDNDKGPDNDGVSRKRQVITPRGPSDIGLRLNYGAMWCALTAEEKKLTWVSTSPENFVCNNTAFRFTERHPEQMYGFIHVPNVTCEKKTPDITTRSIALISKMISIQLDTRASLTSRIEWPMEFNDVRLPETLDDVRTLLRGPVESCEKELLERWRKDF
jgi:pyroglutamyl-peptidase